MNEKNQSPAQQTLHSGKEDHQKQQNLDQSNRAKQFGNEQKSGQQSQHNRGNQALGQHGARLSDMGGSRSKSSKS